MLSIQKSQNFGNHSQHLDLSKITLKRTIVDKSGRVYSICLLKDGRLASSSRDKVIKIYNLSTYKQELVLDGHNDSVVYLCLLDKGYLASSSKDKSIKIWSITENFYKCLITIHEHEDCPFKIVQVSNDRMISCAWDKRINIIKSSVPFKCIKRLNAKGLYVHSVIELKNKRHIVSSSDKTIRFWNNITYECEHIIKEIYCRWSNSLNEIKPNKLVVGGYQEIAIVNVVTFQLESIIRNDESRDFRCIIGLKDETFLCGCDRILLQLDSNTYSTKLTKNNVHDDYIVDIKIFNETSFISCSFDGKIKFWGT